MATQSVRLERLFEKMDEGMLIVDRDWGILYANDFARRYLNLQDQSHVQRELAARLSKRFICNTDVDTLFAGDSVEEEWSVTFEAISQNEEGHPPFVLSIYMSRPTEDGVRFILLRDVTEERGEELWKEKFLSLISHKLMTPLTTIKGNLDAMHEGIFGPLAQKQEGAVGVSLDKVRVLERSVRRLIEYASLQKLAAVGVTERIDAALVTRAFCERFATTVEKDIALTFTNEAGEAAVVGRTTLLQSALDCILGNAAKFHPGPKVKVAVAVRRDADRALRVSVRDDGPGIPPSLQSDILKEFVQRDDDFTGNVEGLGLGLPFCVHLMKIFGGRLEIASEPGQGTTVDLIFPPLPPRTPEGSAAR